MKYLTLLIAVAFLMPAFQPAAESTFEAALVPFVDRNCTGCHNQKAASGGLNLTAFRTAAEFQAQRETWDKVLDRIRTGDMPPKGAPRPDAEETRRVSAWLEREFARQDAAMKLDPGRVTARRLNRYEYNNTVRDLLAVDFRPADDFPADDFNYGFDNIADALSISPILMEKYLTAAHKIARAAIQPAPLPKKPFVDHHTNLAEKKTYALKRRFAWEADYDIRFAVPYLIMGRNDSGTLYVSFDGGAPKSYLVGTEYINEGKFTEVRMHIPAGTHEFKAWVVRDDEAAIESDWKKELDRIARLKEPGPAAGGGRRRDASPPRTREEVAKKVLESKPMFVEFIDVRGPYGPKPAPAPEGYGRVFACGHGPGAHKDACARQGLLNVARQAWRRPVTNPETAKLMSFYRMARSKGDSVDDAVQVGLKAVLVSPNFLFRIENHPNPNDPKAVRELNDFELATRLSYFLWSTLPDEELFRLAGEGKLRDQAVLRGQMRRMLQSPKAFALVDNFAGQWLHLRNLETWKPDPDKFPSFTAELKDAMQTETRLFLTNLIREDGNILDLLTAKYTYLNDNLASYYGVPGVKGDEFRKVSLTGTPRAGILTHASVLTVSSYPTRTSPVLRGKWILENLLNAPPPPPPADVPALDETGVGVTGSLRQQLEKHRENPICSSCRSRMDPLGFGLENFDAVGRWRTHDGKIEVDSKGTLPDGRSFSTPDELSQVLAGDSAAFTRCFAEKLMIFALGRSVERSDKPAVDAIARRAASNGYRFSSLIEGIVESAPFRMHRGEARRAQGRESK